MLLLLFFSGCNKFTDSSNYLVPNRMHDNAIKVELDLLKLLFNNNMNTMIISDENKVIINNLYNKLSLKYVPLLLIDKMEQKFLISKLYFIHRRFIESSIMFALILEKKPLYTQARNILARCFYFLGNYDRALNELNYIILHQYNDLWESMSALYLIGLFVEYSELVTDIHIKKAVLALNTYLKLLNHDFNKIEIKALLSSLKYKINI